MSELKIKLKKLRDEHFLTAIKTGTEVEAMTFEEIAAMREISFGIVPMIVKIGGPEARNDMKQMLRLGIDVILAPMVESVYSLQNFVEAMDSLDPSGRTKRAINLETITAYQNLSALFSSGFFSSIHQVTVGRSDLSGSMGRSADHPEVMQAAKNIVKLARYYNKTTSVGGKINPDNSEQIRNEIMPEHINTRHVMVLAIPQQIPRRIEAALEWEKELYCYLSEKIPDRKAFYLDRIASIETRQKVKIPA